MSEIQITADQFLAQVDRTLVGLTGSHEGQFLPYTATQLRECFLGAYYALKAHETRFDELETRMNQHERYVARIVQTHGLQPARETKDRTASPSTMIVTGRGGETK